MVKNPQRTARLEEACQKLYAAHGPGFGVKELAKEARVSNTVAGPFLQNWRAKLNPAIETLSVPEPAPKATSEIVPSLIGLVSSSQEHVTSLIAVVESLVERVTELTVAGNLSVNDPPAPPSKREFSIASEMADLVGSAVPEPTTKILALEAEPAHVPPGIEPSNDPSPPVVVGSRERPIDSARAVIDPADGLTPLEPKAYRSDRPGSKRDGLPAMPKTSKARPGDRGMSTAAKPHEQRDALLLQAARDILADERGALAYFEIHRLMPKEIQELSSTRNLKRVFERNPALIHFEELDEKYWLTIRDLHKEPTPIWKAAVDEAGHILKDKTHPISPDDIHAGLPAEIATVLSVASLSKAMKMQGRHDQRFLQVADGKWVWRESAEADPSANPFGKPSEYMPDLRREAEHILAENGVPMSGADIQRQLGTDLQHVFELASINRHLEQLPPTVFVRDEDDKLWRLAKWPRGNKPSRRKKPVSKRARNQARTKVAVEAASRLLRETGLVMTLDELYGEIAPDIDRKMFRRGMLNRRLSMHLELIDDGLYRYNPRR